VSNSCFKHNTPSQPDGEQAFWIDGALQGHWKGFNWRTDAQTASECFHSGKLRNQSLDEATIQHRLLRQRSDRERVCWSCGKIVADRDFFASFLELPFRCRLYEIRKSLNFLNELGTRHINFAHLELRRAHQLLPRILDDSRFHHHRVKL
jgi:hypothetical protein